MLQNHVESRRFVHRSDFGAILHEHEHEDAFFFESFDHLSFLWFAAF